MTNDATFTLNLFDNGIDFILKGIDELFDDQSFLNDYKLPTQFTPQNFKYGCLHLFSGFLLILKERLSRHIPELIYKGRLPEVKERLKNKNNKLPNTVDFDELLERLEIGPRVVFNEREMRVLRKMQGLRNTFEHAQVEFNRNDIWKTLSEFLDIVDSFLVTQFNIEIENSEEGKRLSNKIKKIDSVWQRTLEAREKEEDESLASKLEEFLSRKEEILEEIEDSRWDHSRDADNFMICTDCGKESIITSGEFTGVCIECDTIIATTNCVRCQGLRAGRDWDPDYCDACKDYIAGA